MMLAENHLSALLVTGASMLMCLLLLGLWRVSRERFLLLAAVAQALFTAHQLPLFADAASFASWPWRAAFASLFGLYLGLTALVINLLFTPPSRLALRVTKLYLWLIVPTCICLFGFYDSTSFLGRSYAHHRLTANNLIALLVNVGLTFVVVRRFYIMQHQLLQSRMDADFAAERAKLTERQRIMQDIHDTVGSQLVGVLSLIRAGAPHAQLETQTEDALQGLRIAIDAIQPVNGNLAAVLASLRHRLQPRLDAAGLKLIWRVDDLPRVQDLSPQKIQHIQRIVMEAFSNVIQHAKATQVIVSARFIEPDLPALPYMEIMLVDNGIGLLDAEVGTGLGLANMRMRAEVIGARMTIKNHGGLCITLELPYAAAL